ncbi:MAG: signal peptidase I [Mariniblastus sp.]|jgi:signal peptidase I
MQHSNWKTRSMVFFVATWMAGISVWVGCDREPTKLPDRIGKVVGGSMAPHFLGKHSLATCEACGFEFTSDWEQANQREFLVCPNCGARMLRSSATSVSGEQLSIVPSKSPKRWDVVAFRLPTDTASPSSAKTQDAGIKRVVGLPGEEVQIRDGDVYVNDHLIRKTLAEQKRVRVHVYDSQFQRKRDLHWELPGLWSYDSGNGFHFRNDDKPSNSIQWMGFRNPKHYSHFESPGDAPAASDFEDFYGYNQSLSRDLNPVSDLFLEFNLVLTFGTSFVWTFAANGDDYQFEIDAENHEMRVVDSKRSTILAIPIDSLGGARNAGNPVTTIEFSSFDDQLQVWVEGQRCFECPLTLADSERLSVSERPAARVKMGARGKQLVVQRIRIWRDLYYLAPSGAADAPIPKWPSASGFLMLGDNAPISIDSRHWDQPRIAESDVIGVVETSRKP